MQSKRRHLVVTEVYKSVPMGVPNSQLITHFSALSANYYFFGQFSVTY